MTQTVLIVGAGPAAVGAALASIRRRDVHVVVVDVGGRLEESNAQARIRMARLSPSEWEQADVATVSRLPVDSAERGLPQKRSFGSNFPFRDFGQLSGLTGKNGVNSALISGAYGGFSNIWGAQLMPFSSATFRNWPVSANDMHAHYRSVLRQIPYAAETDDLASLFPLLEPATPLPKLSARSDAVLGRYALKRSRLLRRGVFLGRARLAMDAADCVRCGLCLTGCPYSLIYSASHTLNKLRRLKQITYYGGLLVVRVEESSEKVTVTARDVHTGRIRRFAADRVLLGCGAIGTSRLVMGSLGLNERPAAISESAQFMLPFISRYAVPDPRMCNDFTLNQFNMVLSLDAEGYDVSQLHFYTYDRAFLNALPAVLRARRTAALRGQLLRRLSVALGYLPSWASPKFSLTAHMPLDRDSLPPVTVDTVGTSLRTHSMLREVLRRVSSSAVDLDLWPLLPMLSMSAPGKSYHWGGTFPHSCRPATPFGSDSLGRVGPWTRIHLIDASVFPTVAATTFTLTIMANAHRIADLMLRELD